MKEYKVEYTSVKKESWCYVIKAESQKDAIAKVKKAGLDLTTVEDHEAVARCQWEASSTRGILDWFYSIIRG